MLPTRMTVLLITAALIASGVGFVDAAVGGQADLAATSGISFVLIAAVLTRAVGRRPEIRLRADLLHWISERAAARGESPEMLLDRAVAAYRAEMTIGASGTSRPVEDQAPR